MSDDVPVTLYTGDTPLFDLSKKGKLKVSETLREDLVRILDGCVFEGEPMQPNDGTINEILAAVRKRVPPEKEVKNYHPQFECDLVHLTYEAKSWNECRSQIMKALE